MSLLISAFLISDLSAFLKNMHYVDLFLFPVNLMQSFMHSKKIEFVETKIPSVNF